MTPSDVWENEYPNLFIILGFKNPLLIGKGLPPFDQVKAEQVVPAMTQILEELEQEVTKLENNVTPTWEGLVEPLTAIEERLGWTWGICFIWCG